ncbi:peptidyl-prolyl cis-trans isomerase FKBP8-like [Liolophura sinensis]|uniref:peptidyl-prolyl cis-trans isomerase FKBP8-like n=1 Tax=Liolophura sinensis TaxID=3198878 RepID=UPI0031597417
MSEDRQTSVNGRVTESGDASSTGFQKGKSALEISGSSNDDDDSRLGQNAEENIPDITMDEDGNYNVVSGDDCNNKSIEENNPPKEGTDSLNNENQQSSDISSDLSTSVSEKIKDSIESESQTVSDRERQSETENKMKGHENISNSEQPPDDKMGCSEAGGKQVKNGPADPTQKGVENGQQEEKESDPKPLDILGNGMLLKKVIKPSENPDSRPSYGDQVTLRTVGTLEDGSVVDKHDSITFTLGDGDVIQAWDLCTALMDVGEVCQLTTDNRYAYGNQGRPPSIPANSKITYTLELLKKDEPVDLTKLSVENRIKFGDEKRERGNYLFGRSDYTGAINSYSKALKILNDDNLSHSEEDVSLLQQLVDTRVKCYNNIAAAQLKVEAYAAAIKSCDEVLKVQPQNIKALFRKGKALASKGNTELAITVLKRAVQLDPESKIVQQELFKQTKKLKKETESEKEMYKKMFGSSKAPVEDKKEPENAVYRWTSWGLAVIGGTAAFLVSGAIALYRSLRG